STSLVNGRTSALVARPVCYQRAACIHYARYNAVTVRSQSIDVQWQIISVSRIDGSLQSRTRTRAQEMARARRGREVGIVEEYHRIARIPLPRKARRLHATIHMVVENQLALNDEPVLRALERLKKEGLTRHDAVHAIGSQVAEHIYDI